MAEKNYYEILGVEPRAPATVIEKAYWRLARVVHQEKGDVQAAAHLLALNEAYEHLGDGRKRAAYNDQLGMPQEEEPPRRQGWLKRLWSH